MTSQRLRKLVTAQPFRPFCVCMSNGQVYDVKHPEFVAVSPRDDIALLFHDDGEYSILDLLLMTEIKVGASESAQAN